MRNHKKLAPKKVLGGIKYHVKTTYAALPYETGHSKINSIIIKEEEDLS